MLHKALFISRSLAMLAVGVLCIAPVPLWHHHAACCNSGDETPSFSSLASKPAGLEHAADDGSCHLCQAAHSKALPTPARSRVEGAPDSVPAAWAEEVLLPVCFLGLINARAPPA